MQIHYIPHPVFLLLFALVSTETIVQSSENNFRQIEIPALGETLQSRTVSPSENMPFAYNPMRLLNVNDDFIVVQDFRDDSFFTNLRWDTLEITSQWGEVSQGPEPYEFTNYPFHTFSRGDRIISIDGLTSEIRELRITEQGAETQNRQRIQYRSDTGILNRMVPLRNDLIIAINESFIDGQKSEWIAFSRDEEEEKFKFGSHPGEAAAGMDPWDFYIKNGIGRPDGSRMAAFYSNQNAIKIFDDTGRELHAVIPVENHMRTTARVFSERAEQLIRTPQWADDEYIFALKFIYEGEETHSQLEVWNWDGELVYRANLDQDVSAITASREHGKIVGVHYEQEQKLFVWDFDESKLTD